MIFANRVTLPLVCREEKHSVYSFSQEIMCGAVWPKLTSQKQNRGPESIFTKKARFIAVNLNDRKFVELWLEYPCLFDVRLKEVEN